MAALICEASKRKAWSYKFQETLSSGLRGRQNIGAVLARTRLDQSAFVNCSELFANGQAL